MNLGVFTSASGHEKFDRREFGHALVVSISYLHFNCVLKESDAEYGV